MLCPKALLKPAISIGIITQMKQHAKPATARMNVTSIIASLKSNGILNLNA